MRAKGGKPVPQKRTPQAYWGYLSQGGQIIKKAPDDWSKTLCMDKLEDEDVGRRTVPVWAHAQLCDKKVRPLAKLKKNDFIIFTTYLQEYKNQQNVPQLQSNVNSRQLCRSPRCLQTLK